ncbi:MAG: 50S ribosomal protein L21 [Firmicutes bacterium]|nr:50S ribosomal protein L21 [Bacillota bacterium]
MYAVIETGGKQYRVQEGDVVFVEKLGLVEGENYVFDKVLAVFTDDGAMVGKPYVEGAKVSATTLKEGRAKKVIVYKYKSKKGYHKKQGHRQCFTKLQINSIQA